MDIEKLQKQKKKNKTNVNVTIDIDLLEKLKEFKKKHQIELLSPMINSMLWDWIIQENKLEEKRGDKK